ncbi:MAG: TolC family protein [Chloracidobacterium sp.]|nr:TolC family protein [Chloracidobacterium sp.]
MHRHLYIFVFLVFAVTATQPLAQAPSPTSVVDAQNVAPEDIRGVPAIAVDYRSNIRTLPDLGRVGVDMTDQKSLTLNEALALALENNLDIEVTRKNVRIAKYDLDGARGVFQPRLAGQSYYESSALPNINFFSPTTRLTNGDSFIGNSGIQAYIPKFGTSYSVTMNNQRFTTDNPLTVISPQYNSSLSFNLTQPLFRGRKFDQGRRAIEIAKRNISLTDTQFKQRSIEVVANVQRAYWDLTYALRNLQVQRDSVRDAKSQLEHNRRLVDEGQLAPIDIVAAETQVANFEQAVYDALNGVNLAENSLKNLISPDRNNPIWSESLTPVDPVELSVPITTLTEAIDTAIQNRPELEINKTQKEINAIDQRFFREQKKPQIDLIASYSSSGVGGSLNPNSSNPLLRGCAEDPTTPECVAAAQALQALLQNVGGGGTAVSDIFRNKYPTYRVGLQFNIPLFGDKSSRAQYGRSLVEGERLETQREQAEQTIQVEVRNALQAIRTSEGRLRAAAVARENTAKQYESEQRKLDSGQSDIYKVLERQTALAAAKSNELKARTDLNKAIADLQRATGNSLRANNIEPKLEK